MAVVPLATTFSYPHSRRRAPAWTINFFYMAVNSPSWGKIARNATFLGAGGLLASSVFMRAFSGVFSEREVCPILSNLFLSNTYGFKTSNDATAWLEREFVHVSRLCRLLVQHVNRIKEWPKAQQEFRTRTIGTIQTAVLPHLVRLWKCTQSGLSCAAVRADMQGGEAIKRLKYVVFIFQNALGNKYGDAKRGNLDLGLARAIMRRVEDLDKKLYTNINAMRASARILNLQRVHSNRVGEG